MTESGRAPSIRRAHSALAGDGGELPGAAPALAFASGEFAEEFGMALIYRLLGCHGPLGRYCLKRTGRTSVSGFQFGEFELIGAPTPATRLEPGTDRASAGRGGVGDGCTKL